MSRVSLERPLPRGGLRNGHKSWPSAQPLSPAGKSLGQDSDMAAAEGNSVWVHNLRQVILGPASSFSKQEGSTRFVPFFCGGAIAMWWKWARLEGIIPGGFILFLKRYLENKVWSYEKEQKKIGFWLSPNVDVTTLAPPSPAEATKQTNSKMKE